jgi:hypothetical protein
VFARVSPAQEPDHSGAKIAAMSWATVRRHQRAFSSCGGRRHFRFHRRRCRQDAADFYFAERSLSVLHDGIIEGRKAFGNVMKYLLMGRAQLWQMFSMAIASLPTLSANAGADSVQ